MSCQVTAVGFLAVFPVAVTQEVAAAAVGSQGVTTAAAAGTAALLAVAAMVLLLLLELALDVEGHHSCTDTIIFFITAITRQGGHDLPPTCGAGRAHLP